MKNRKALMGTLIAVAAVVFGVFAYYGIAGEGLQGFTRINPGRAPISVVVDQDKCNSELSSGFIFSSLPDYYQNAKYGSFDVLWTALYEDSLDGVFDCRYDFTLYEGTTPFTNSTEAMCSVNKMFFTNLPNFLGMDCVIDLGSKTTVFRITSANGDDPEYEVLNFYSDEGRSLREKEVVRSMTVRASDPLFDAN